MKNKALQLVVLFSLLFATSCRRTEIPVDPTPPTNPVGGLVNDATQVTASISGIVLDESNAPIPNAVVSSGTATTTTNSNGMFIFQNISISKENGSVTVEKAGYFKGVRSFKTIAGKDHVVRLQLMAKTLTGTVNGASGGTITSNGGATIVFPANAFVTTTGTIYTGTVNIYSRWIDPTSANLPFVIPGDLRGVNIAGQESILETYGMVGAELTDAVGNTLKIATGKTATVTFPIPASLTATAPATIVLWHFDDATARWKENGTATKIGSSYIAQVDKFSFWNADVPSNNFINLDYTLINATANSPLASTYTRIKKISNGSYGYGITNSNGFVSGLVPKNEALILEVIAYGTCGTVTYSQNIGPFAVNTSLGNININFAASQFVNFTGTILNCTGGIVNNGYISLFSSNGFGGFANVNSSGIFNFSVPNCSGTNFTYSYQAFDNATSQQSSLLTGSASAGSSINLGNITSCNSVAIADIYVAGTEGGIAKVWKNSIATNLSTAIDSSSANSVFVSGNDVYVAGKEKQFARLWINGVGTNLSTSTTNNSAEAVFVSGTNVYVAGYESNFNNGTSNFTIPKIWVNGVATILPLSSPYINGLAKSVYVQGTDVYVVGLATTAGSNASVRAAVWKNGVLSILNGGLTSTAESVFVFGSDVYVSGGATFAVGEQYSPVFWKNGVMTQLASGNTGIGSSIYYSGSDIYVSGYSKTPNGVNSLVYWKNSVPTILSSGFIYSDLTSISVKNNDVYVAGIQATGISTNARVWKNGLTTNFFNNTNNIYANSIFVK